MCFNFWPWDARRRVPAGREANWEFPLFFLSFFSCDYASSPHKLLYPRFLPTSALLFLLLFFCPPPNMQREASERFHEISLPLIPPASPPIPLPFPLRSVLHQEVQILIHPSMESHPKTQDKESALLRTASLNTTSNRNSNQITANGAAAYSLSPQAPQPYLTPKSIPKNSEVNPYPATFVQANASSFKQVVQMLTGSAETAAAAAASKGPMARAAKLPGPKKPAFKLYAHCNSLKNLKIIRPLIPTFFNSNSNPNSPVGAAAFSPRNQGEILSPCMLDFPSLVLSPVTPLIPDPFNRPPHPGSEAAKLAEDRAIAEKGFYLHPSPRTTPKDAEPPRLLPLFPVTSPRVSSSSASSDTPSAP